MPRLSEVLLITFCLLVVGWVSVSLYRWQRDINEYADARSDLQQLITAMHQYHDDHDVFPPSFVRGPDGGRWHSWRALLLPYLEPSLASRYRFDEPWNGPNNTQLSQSAPDVFRSDVASSNDAATHYFAVIGKRTLWPAWQSVSIEGVTDGTSNTIAIVEDDRSDIGWLEPRDPRLDELVDDWDTNQVLYEGMGRHTALADGSVWFFSRNIDRARLLGLLTPRYRGTTFEGDDWPDDLEPPLPIQQLAAARMSDTLAATDIHSSWQEPLTPERNQLWCASFQIAWDMSPLPVPNDNQIATLLNQSTFDADSLSPKAVFVAATDTSRAEDAQLATGLRQQFPDLTPPLQQPSQQEPYMVRLFAAIRKQMPFATRFDRFRDALPFGANDTPVNNFGLAPQADRTDLRGYQDQVTILDDYGDDNCIVRLSTSGPQKDHIILALTPPESTLHETWISVQDRIRNPNPKHHRFSMETDETLQIPVMDLSLSHHFDELEDVSWTDTHGNRFTIDIAFQEIRLRLDETGADLMSMGEVIIFGEFGGSDYNPDRIRHFVFNRPFFIAMKEPHADQPYLLAWIANAELMEPFSN